MEIGDTINDFKPGDRVIIPAITPDWRSLEAQAGLHQHSNGMLAGWKFSNFKDGVFGISMSPRTSFSLGLWNGSQNHKRRALSWRSPQNGDAAQPCAA